MADTLNSKNQQPQKAVTLSDLSNGSIPTETQLPPSGMPPRQSTLNKNEVKKANLSEAVQQSKPEIPDGLGNPMIDKALKSLDPAIENMQKRTDELYQQGVEERAEQDFMSDAVDNFDKTAKKDAGTIIVHKDEPITDYKKQTTNQNTNTISDNNIGTIDSSGKTDHTQSIHVLKEEPMDILAAENTHTEYDEAKDIHKPVSITRPIHVLQQDDTTVEKVNTKEDDLFAGLKFPDDDELDLLDSDNEKTEKELEDEEEKNRAAEMRKRAEEERRNSLRSMANNIKPVEHELDLSTFKISTKTINASKIINKIQNDPMDCADGVLWSERRAIRMSAMKPLELQKLDSDNVGNRSSDIYKYMRSQIRLIYDHIVDDNKPESFEAWTKITPNTSIDDYMFAAYKATFGRANIITYSCENPDCENVFMEKRSLNDLIKFRNDEIAEEYERILIEDFTNSTNADYKVDLYQASDDYVIGLKTPTLFNTFIEQTYVDNKFKDPYEDLLLLISYIDSIYVIDRDHGILIPIDTHPEQNNPSLTYKRKVKTYATILKSLTSDQLQSLSVETDKYDNTKLDDDGNPINDISYVYPECKCPKCGKTIKEQEVSATQMLFTRHQLALMKRV